MDLADFDSRPDTGNPIERLRALLPELRARFGLRSVAVFGSYARGEAGPRSDFDLLVEFDRVPGLLTFVGIEQELSERLGVPVEMVTRAALKPTIGRQVLREAIPL